MHQRIVLQAVLVIVVLVCSDLDPCKWELEDCRSMGTTHPDYSTNCYKEYGNQVRLCRTKCVGHPPYSGKCRGYCGEYIKRCLSQEETSPETPVSSSAIPTPANPTEPPVTAGKNLPNTSDYTTQTGSETETGPTNRSKPSNSTTSQTVDVLIGVKVWVPVFAVMSALIIGLMIVIYCQKARGNEVGQTVVHYATIPPNDTPDPVHPVKIKETTV